LDKSTTQADQERPQREDQMSPVKDTRCLRPPASLL